MCRKGAGPIYMELQKTNIGKIPANHSTLRARFQPNEDVTAVDPRDESTGVVLFIGSTLNPRAGLPTEARKN
ncbi:hypothetical protein K7X08_018362 [Anisodus acutangulus]|uniref:Uncharacterized protein n=1 Tax=Anisodus acutangulus TaxID=402998 RepID=A0A9Q1LZ40_9SOLA|nr:hypothetical protein K7X08_018362 [Anisodus acutangulus]